MAGTTTIMALGLSLIAPWHDIQRQVDLAHDSILSNSYQIEQKIENPVGHSKAYFRALGYSSSMTAHDMDKCRSNNVGFLIGWDKQCTENLLIGVFAGYQYAKCSYESHMTVSIDGLQSNEKGHFEKKLDDFDGGTKTQTAMAGAYGKYEYGKWTAQVAGSLGYIHYDHDLDLLEIESLNQLSEKGQPFASLTDILPTAEGKHHCVSGDLAGELSYDFSSREDMKFGPFAGIGITYLIVDGYASGVNIDAGFSAMEEGRKTHKHANIRTDHHAFRSVHTSLGLFGSKLFDLGGRSTSVYAKLAWKCDCIRNGDSFHYELDVQTEDSTSATHNNYSAGISTLCFPRNRVEGKVGLQVEITKQANFDAAIALAFAKDYYNVSGEISVGYNF